MNEKTKEFLLAGDKCMPEMHLRQPGFATDTTPKAKVNEVKNEIPSITNLATTAALNAKINEVKIKIPNITKVINNTALTAVENKISDQSKYITTQEFNKLTAENYIGRFKQANLLSKNYISTLVTDFVDELKKFK